MRISGFKILRGAVAALCKRRPKEGKSDSSAVMSVFSAKGALLRSAWGDAPGIINQEGLSAESAYRERHEARLQPRKLSGMPQVRHGESVLWRTRIEPALSALNTSAVPDRRYSAAFSLVEIVLALGVAAFCLIAIVGLMPVGVQTNRHATSQTAATNIMAAVVADLRTTPSAATTSPQFAITFDTEKTLFFDASGQPSTSLGPDSRYRLNITWNSAPTGLQYADLRVTWPASVDPATGSPSGLVKTFAAFDRN